MPRWVASFAFVSMLAACDILFPPPISLAQQLDYAPQARERLQILARWWPLLVPISKPRTAPAWPVPPIALPTSFAAGTSTPAAFGGPTTPTVQCREDICNVTWRNHVGVAPYVVALTVAADGRILGGSSVVTDSVYGAWRHVYGPDLKPQQAQLWQPTLSPVAAWAVQCAAEACTYTADYRNGLRAIGKVTAQEVTGSIDLSDWSGRFPWAGEPLAITWSTRAARESMAITYATGLSWRRSIDLQAGTWVQRGPAHIRADGNTEGGMWDVVAEFDDSQVLFSWQLRADLTTSALPRAFLETRQSTRATRREIHAVLSDASSSAWSLMWREDHTRGVVQATRDALGWRLDAFWNTDFGDLIKITGLVFDTGVWLGSFEGWSPEDIQSPREAGDWTLFPDGSFRVLILFRQANDTLTELDSYSPPEGVSPFLLGSDNEP